MRVEHGPGGDVDVAGDVDHGTGRDVSTRNRDAGVVPRRDAGKGRRSWITGPNTTRAGVVVARGSARDTRYAAHRRQRHRHHRAQRDTKPHLAPFVCCATRKRRTLRGRMMQNRIELLLSPTHRTAPPLRSLISQYLQQHRHARNKPDQCRASHPAQASFRNTPAGDRGCPIVAARGQGALAGIGAGRPCMLG